MTHLFGIGLLEIDAHGVHLGDSLSKSHPGFQMSERLKNPMGVPARAEDGVPGHLLFIDDRDKEIGRDKYQSPVEIGRRYTDNGKRMLIELDNLAYHAAVILKTAVPVGVGKDNIRSAIAAVLIGGVEDATKIRLSL